MNNTSDLGTLSIGSVVHGSDCRETFGHIDIDAHAVEHHSLMDTQTVPKIVEAGAIFVCTAGQAEIMLDRKRYILHAGDLCLVFPYTIFQAISRSDDLRGHIYAVDVDYIKHLVTPTDIPDYIYIKDNPCISLSPERQRGLMMLCDLIEYKATEKEDPFSREMTRHLLTIFAYEITTIYTQARPKLQNRLSRQDRVFQQFMFSLTRNYRLHRDVEFYAEEACLTPRHFSFVIKQKSGRTAAAWITEKVVSQARSMLQGTTLTVQQIADELGFPNPSFFGQYFKKHTGSTPKAYRDSADKP